MIPSRRPAAIRLLVGASLTLLAMASIAPSAARAQCARLSHAEPAAASRFDYLDPSAAMPGPDSGTPAPKPACPGGSCSSAPVRPLAPGPVPPPKSEHWGCLPSPEPPPSSADAPMPADDPALHALHRGLAVFHPPRP